MGLAVAGMETPNAQVHALFEEWLCKDLRASGQANFVAAHGCTVSFISKETRTNGEAEIIFKGLIRDVSKDDAELVEKAITEAYNDAFGTAGAVFSVEFGTALDKVQGGECGRYCPPDDDVNESVTLFVAKLKGGECGRYCPPDDDTALTDAKVGAMHTAFEKTLCNKLSSSGSANFANVHGCKVGYINSADKGVKKSQQ